MQPQKINPSKENVTLNDAHSSLQIRTTLDYDQTRHKEAYTLKPLLQTTKLQMLTTA